MQMKKMQGIFSWVVVLSECSHVFCCVLPSLFSVLTLLVGIGVMGAMPVWMQSFHEMMHGWEIPMMMASGIIVLVGWGLYHISQKIDCHDTGCGHGACAPKKKRSEYVLKIATFLFLGNVLIYMVFHKGIDHVIHSGKLDTIQSVSDD